MGQLSRVNYICRRIASNQMLLNFGLTRSAGRSSDENEGAASLASKTCRNASVDLTCAFLMRASSALLIPAAVRTGIIT